MRINIEIKAPEAGAEVVRLVNKYENAGARARFLVQRAGTKAVKAGDRLFETAYLTTAAARAALRASREAAGLRRRQPAQDAGQAGIRHRCARERTQNFRVDRSTTKNHAPLHLPRSGRHHTNKPDLLLENEMITV